MKEHEEYVAEVRVLTSPFKAKCIKKSKFKLIFKEILVGSLSLFVIKYFLLNLTDSKL